jgi:hypothetical protein
MPELEFIFVLVRISRSGFADTSRKRAAYPVREHEEGGDAVSKLDKRWISGE